MDTRTLRSGHVKPGFTCCQAEDLGNEASLPYERIGHIFVRNSLGVLPFPVVGKAKAKRVGDEPEDKTPSGPWPSDHAGVFAKLSIPILQQEDQTRCLAGKQRRGNARDGRPGRVSMTGRPPGRCSPN